MLQEKNHFLEKITVAVLKTNQTILGEESIVCGGEGMFSVCVCF